MEYGSNKNAREDPIKVPDKFTKKMPTDQDLKLESLLITIEVVRQDSKSFDNLKMLWLNILSVFSDCFFHNYTNVDVKHKVLYICISWKSF